MESKMSPWNNRNELIFCWWDANEGGATRERPQVKKPQLRTSVNIISHWETFLKTAIIFFYSNVSLDPVFRWTLLKNVQSKTNCKAVLPFCLMLHLVGTGDKLSAYLSLLFPSDSQITKVINIQGVGSSRNCSEERFRQRVLSRPLFWIPSFTKGMDHQRSVRFAN